MLTFLKSSSLNLDSFSIPDKDGSAFERVLVNRNEEEERAYQISCGAR